MDYKRARMTGNRMYNSVFYDNKCQFPSLAMVYSPNQEWREIYDAEYGLCRGTIFKELDKPWCGGKYRGECFVNER